MPLLLRRKYLGLFLWPQPSLISVSWKFPKKVSCGVHGVPSAWGGCVYAHIWCSIHDSEACATNRALSMRGCGGGWWRPRIIWEAAEMLRGISLLMYKVSDSTIWNISCSLTASAQLTLNSHSEAVIIVRSEAPFLPKRHIIRKLEIHVEMSRREKLNYYLMEGEAGDESQNK